MRTHEVHAAVVSELRILEDNLRTGDPTEAMAILKRMITRHRAAAANIQPNPEPSKQALLEEEQLNEQGPARREEDPQEYARDYEAKEARSMQ